MKTTPLLVAAALAAALPALRADGAPQPLSPEVLGHIAGMTPLFDGSTLDGWIQAPPYAEKLSAGDFSDLPGFAAKLAAGAEPLSAHLGGKLDDAQRTSLAHFPTEAAEAKKATSALLKAVNAAVAGPSLYDAERFKGVALRPATEALRARNPAGQELIRLNRLLLEDAYPKEIAASPAAAWIVKDGAIASTGSGRGVIYTRGDYTRYRLVFSIRHVSGNPDHQPCVLVFCQRPAAGELGLDALGGIQFQVPNGGHWDYRPGHNNGGSSFVNPQKPKYDNHVWSQVEILVDARAGTARMAVAQPAGTRGVENLDFKEAAAGRTGPIALQMHNAGLFDEFKDIRIEVDPADDKLITAE